MPRVGSETLAVVGLEEAENGDYVCHSITVKESEAYEFSSHMTNRRKEVHAMKRLLWILLMMLIPHPAEGGHFKYASLSWSKPTDLPPNYVRFTLVSAWSTKFLPFQLQTPNQEVAVGDTIRIQGLGNPVLNFGDGKSSVVLTKVLLVDNDLEMWRGEAVIEHEYTNSSRNYIAYFSGCCRSQSVLNRHDGYFNVSTEVSMSELVPFSPRIAILPRVILQTDALSPFYVTAFDSGPHPLQSPNSSHFEWTLKNETDWNANGLYINRTTGEMWVNNMTDLAKSTATAENLYSILVEVSDTKYSTVTQADLELQIFGAQTVIPEYDGNFSQGIDGFPAVNEVYKMYTYQHVMRFIMPGADQLSMRLLTSTLPDGFAVSPVNPMSTNVRGGYMGYEASLVWTVPAIKDSWTVICFQVFTNSTSHVGSAQTCLDFYMRQDHGPVWENPTLNIMQEYIYMGQTWTYELVAKDMNLADNVTITPIDLPLGATVTPVYRDPNIQSNIVSMNVTWMPPPKSGGEELNLCFEASDYLNGMNGGGSSRVCFETRIPKCLYMVRSGDTLKSIAANFSTSWLQLWALNKQISKPEGYGFEGGITAGQILNVGQLVLINPGDTLEKLAAKFGTTMRLILDMNKDITPLQPLVVGQYVCVIPSSCAERAL
eukprot:760334-Hanusia_phi.AAC.5